VRLREVSSHIDKIFVLTNSNIESMKLKQGYGVFWLFQKIVLTERFQRDHYLNEAEGNFIWKIRQNTRKPRLVLQQKQYNIHQNSCFGLEN